MPRNYVLKEGDLCAAGLEGLAAKDQVEWARNVYTVATLNKEDGNPLQGHDRALAVLGHSILKHKLKMLIDDEVAKRGFQHFDDVFIAAGMRDVDVAERSVEEFDEAIAWLDEAKQ